MATKSQYHDFIMRLRKINERVDYQEFSIKEKNFINEVENGTDNPIPSAKNLNLYLTKVCESKNILYALARNNNISPLIFPVMISSPHFDSEVGLELLKRPQIRYADIEMLMRTVGYEKVKKEFEKQWYTHGEQNISPFSQNTLYFLTEDQSRCNAVGYFPLLYIEDEQEIKNYVAIAKDLSEREITYIANNIHISDKLRNQFVALGIDHTETLNFTPTAKREHISSLISAVFEVEYKHTKDFDIYRNAMADLQLVIMNKELGRATEEVVFNLTMENCNDSSKMAIAKTILDHTENAEIFQILIRNADNITDKDVWMAAVTNKICPDSIVNAILQLNAKTMKENKVNSEEWSEARHVAEKILYSKSHQHTSTRPISLATYRMLLETNASAIIDRIASMPSTPKIVLNKIVELYPESQTAFIANINKEFKDAVSSHQLISAILNKIKNPTSLIQFDVSEREFECLKRTLSTYKSPDKKINDGVQKLLQKLELRVDDIKKCEESGICKWEKGAVGTNTLVYTIDIEKTKQCSCEEISEKLKPMSKGQLNYLESKLMHEFDDLIHSRYKPEIMCNVYRHIDEYNRIYTMLQDIQKEKTYNMIAEKEAEVDER